MLSKIKLRCLALALAAMIVTLISQETLAYFTTVGKATNVVTSGDIELVIHERTDQGTEFPAEGVYVVPGDVVSKVVSVENVSGHPFYLRVKLVYGINAQELPAEDCFKLNIDETYWTYKDGWYYYTGIVQPGEQTPAIFSHVEIVGAQVDNSYIGKTLSITVVAQAVQSENNPIQNGDTTTVVGWPAD